MRGLVAMVLVATAVGIVVVTLGRPLPLAPIGEGGGARNLLVGRFIDRSQRFRRAGAFVAIVSMVGYLTVADAADGQGIDLDLLRFATIGLAGSIGGSILAEAFRARQRGPRTASLDVRDPDEYRDRVADRRERVLLVLAAVGMAGAAVTGEQVLLTAALGSVVVALAVVRHWAVRRIALRPRPVVSAEVAAADDEVRRLAASAGVSRPIVTLGALAVSRQWVALVASPADGSEPVTAASIVSVVAVAGSVALFVIACGWWWRNRSFGLTPLRLGAAGGPRSHLRWWALAIIGTCIAMMALLVLARGSG